MDSSGSSETTLDFGAPNAILRTTELRLGTFADADEAFAYDEGEDDRSLASWQREHRKFWERTAAARGASWSEEDELVFERFEVVWPAASSTSSGRTAVSRSR